MAKKNSSEYRQVIVKNGSNKLKMVNLVGIFGQKWNHEIKNSFDICLYYIYEGLTTTLLKHPHVNS